jgi:GTP-binding protein Era
MVREKILETMSEEIPYVTAVITEKFDESNPKMPKIYCAIYVERDSQKRMVIGKQGRRIKDIGIKARRDIEKLLRKKVYLQLFVKVVKDWRNQERQLDEIGMDK